MDKEIIQHAGLSISTEWATAASQTPLGIQTEGIRIVRISAGETGFRYQLNENRTIN